MPDWTKLLIGGAATSVLALGAHALGGEKYVSDLDAKAATALSDAGVEGVDVHMSREPAISRVAVLSGPQDGEARSAAAEAVRSIQGIAEVRWADDDAGEGASPDAVTNCQSKVDKAVAGKTVNFRSGSAYMSANSHRVAEAVTGAMKECGDLKITIGGHTDSRGSAEVNRIMSQERADRVKAAMVERGIDASRIIAIGYGSNKPKNEDDAAGQANRRIEFAVGAPPKQPNEAGD